MGLFDFIGDAFSRDARGRAHGALVGNRDLWQNFDANINAQQAGDDDAARNAQMEAYNRLAGIGAEGGMDAGSKAALQQAQFSNAQQAKGNTDAALQRAQAAGRLNSGRALSAQMQAQQGAANSNAMAGTQAAADARQRAMQAMATSGQMAGGARDATNQLNQYNATMRQNAAQQTVDNQAMRHQGIERGNTALADMDMRRVQQARDTAGGIGNAVVSGVTAAATGGLSAIPGAVGIGKAEGGLIEGKAKVPGDDERNDVVSAKLSPGEMVIPRSTVAKGPDAIREFALRLLRGEY